MLPERKCDPGLFEETVLRPLTEGTANPEITSAACARAAACHGVARAYQRLKAAINE